MHHFRSLFSATLLALLVATAVHADAITPHEASQHIGSQATVEGVAAQVSKSKGGTTFINFGGRFPNHVFYAVIFRSLATQFTGVKSLEGKPVAITGTIELYKGKPQIILRSPDQIEQR